MFHITRASVCTYPCMHLWLWNSRVSSDPPCAQAGRPQQSELCVCVRPSLALPAHTHGHNVWPEGREPLWVFKASNVLRAAECFSWGFTAILSHSTLQSFCFTEVDVTLVIRSHNVAFCKNLTIYSIYGLICMFCISSWYRTEAANIEQLFSSKYILVI